MRANRNNPGWLRRLLAPALGLAPYACLTGCSFLFPLFGEEFQPVCGDGFLDDGEECDDGPDNGSEFGFCDADCTFPVCGDGQLNPAFGEQCDDGNNTNGDGCSGFCEAEPSSSFSSAEDINGEQPDLAGFAFFDQLPVDTDGDGAEDSLLLAVIASEFSFFCQDFPFFFGDLDGFLAALSANQVSDEIVLISALVGGRTDPIDAPTTLTGDNLNTIVHGGFAVEGVTNTAVQGDGLGVLDISAISATTLTATYSGQQTLQFFPAADSPVVITPVGFTGQIQANFCNF